jgi:DNA polymerase III delta subunit
MTAEGMEVFNSFYISFSTGDDQLDKIETAINSFPMMQEQTLVVVSDLSCTPANKEILKGLADLCSNCTQDTVLVINFRDEELDTGYGFDKSDFVKTFLPCSTIVRFDKPTPGKFQAWAKKKAFSNGWVLSDSASELFAYMCDCSMWQGELELEKLTAYALSKEEHYTVTEEDVKTICIEVPREGAPFAMSNAAYKWNLKEMLEVLRKSKDDRVEPIVVLSMLTNIFSDMLLFKAALNSGLSFQQACDETKIKGYRATLLNDAIAKPNITVIEKALIECYKTDVKMKSESTDSWVLLDMLVAKIYTPASLRS